LAKKARTPLPPRPVQAPQRRDARKKPKGVPAVGAQSRPPWLLYGFAALGPIALLIVLGVFILGGNGSSTKNVTGAAPKIDYASLPGLQTGKAPWPPEYASLPDRLEPLKLSSLGVQGSVLHIHQHLDVFVNGKHVTVPALVGIYANGDSTQGGFFVELHTHDTSGIIHLEAPKKGVFTLGQFVGVWGVRLSKQCIGGYCAAPGKPLKFYVNGKRFLGNPNNIVLHQHDEYAIVYGKPPAKIPSKYDWGPSGL
jgi:hypothetical protein